MDSIIDSTSTVKDDRKDLVKTLIDKQNPEMVTLVIPIEVDDISIMQTIGHDIDDKRKVLKLPVSFLTEFVRNNLIIRTSIKGNRSVQLVNTINGIMREEVVAGNVMSGTGKRVLGL